MKKEIKLRARDIGLLDTTKLVRNLWASKDIAAFTDPVAQSPDTLKQMSALCYNSAH